ncbi:MAG: hypothetical protein R3F55_14850 [Alphaproteobacteria bacterium]
MDSGSIEETWFERRDRVPLIVAIAAIALFLLAGCGAERMFCGSEAHVCEMEAHVVD